MDHGQSSFSSPEEEILYLRERVSDLEERISQAHRSRDLLSELEQAGHDFAARLSQLVEVTNELSQMPDVDALWRRAVELARDRLGFDRVGIWLRTEEPGVIVGTFGVDFHGEICDERDYRSRVDPDAPDGRVLLSGEPLVLMGEASLTDEQGNVVATGPQAFAALWDGEKVIGHISADNQLHNTSLAWRQCELLRLYGSRLGYLYTQKRTQIEREKLIAKLQDALARIKTLHGLIPICSNCKKIRDDQGYWQAVEVYVHDHSDADFSHSVCPECMQLLYPDLIDEDT